MANKWPTREVDKLLKATLSDDSFIKTAMATPGKARVSGYRVVRDHDYFPYIFFYQIPGPASSANGNKIIKFNPDYDIEVRTLGAPTDDTESIIDRIIEIVGSWSRKLTPNGAWVVSAVFKKEINILESGETAETFYTRRGGTFKFEIVRS